MLMYSLLCTGAWRGASAKISVAGSTTVFHFPLFGIHGVSYSTVRHQADIPYCDFLAADLQHGPLSFYMLL